MTLDYEMPAKTLHELVALFGRNSPDLSSYITTIGAVNEVGVSKLTDKEAVTCQHKPKVPDWSFLYFQAIVFNHSVSDTVSV